MPNADDLPAVISTELNVGGPVHVAELGAPGRPAAPVTVCLHGLGGSHLNWLAVAPGLAGTSRVVAVDLVGHGRTPAAGRTPDLAGHVALAVGVLEQLGAGPVTLVGNSMGGLVAALVAADHPELVDRLVLVDPALPAAMPVIPHPRIVANFVACAVPGLGERFLAERRRRTTPEQSVRRVLRMCCADPGRVDPAVVDAHVALTASIDRARADAAYLTSARSLTAALVRPAALRRALGRIIAPTLLLHGERDVLVPVTVARQAHRDHPAWTFEVAPGVGHVPMLEVPAWTVARILAFAEGVDGRSSGPLSGLGGGQTETGVASSGPALSTQASSGSALSTQAPSGPVPSQRSPNA